MKVSCRESKEGPVEGSWVAQMTEVCARGGHAGRRRGDEQDKDFKKKQKRVNGRFEKGNTGDARHVRVTQWMTDRHSSRAIH